MAKIVVVLIVATLLWFGAAALRGIANNPFLDTAETLESVQ